MSTLNESIVAINQLECLLLSYVRSLDRKNVNALQIILTDIKKQFKIIEKIIKTSKFILSRYVFMKAYFNMIQSRHQTSIKFLEQSKSIAYNINNQFIYDWINHCEKVWTNSLSNAQQNSWKENYLQSNVERNSFDKESIAFYTLPLPQDLTKQR
ncbi:uncharacterized protein LOC123274514 [Cotesia glomerata]|uniref:Uncharacterized protein n=1 Tax=Cotesia glomerata TaxID=32391 RepID=A0AAV7IBZ4_COTGL|nr:uncharacterized protein LOC123274514 [Cotesia glomerata]KAH0548434.1 hypothetical protein KQX54_001456 [Cotesia glomerata]